MIIDYVYKQLSSCTRHHLIMLGSVIIGDNY